MKLCEKPEFVAVYLGFVDLLVWDCTMCSGDCAVVADALWKDVRIGLRNIGDNHNPFFMNECRCEEDGGCWKQHSDDE